MLFDLEDYRTTLRAQRDTFFQMGELLNYCPTMEEIMERGLKPGGDGEDYATTARATLDAFMNPSYGIVGYYRSIKYQQNNTEDLRLVDSLFFEMMDAYIAWCPKWYDFWCAYISFYNYHQNLNEGDIMPSQSENWVFKIMTQEIYDDYYEGMKLFMSKFKSLLEFGAEIIDK